MFCLDEPSNLFVTGAHHLSCSGRRSEWLLKFPFSPQSLAGLPY